jgi:putative transposase
MSRMPRILSQTGLYHVVCRGINRQNIFEEENDFIRFQDNLKGIKEERGFEIYAYCLMTNHVHLFIKEKELGDIAKIMHKLLTKYAGWYNRKYQRSGSLMGNRYKSEPIEDERYFFALTRYIHQNPLKAGIVQNIADYRWSSYGDYLDSEMKNLTDTYFIMNILSDNLERSRAQFIEQHQKLETEDFTLSDRKKPTDEQVRRKIIKLLNGKEPYTIGENTKEERNRILRYLREREGFTIGQLERVTGISRGIITRAYVQNKARPH